jgi:tripartite ATP-independent transporter DctP family solute receptor
MSGVLNTALHPRLQSGNTRTRRTINGINRSGRDSHASVDSAKKVVNLFPPRQTSSQGDEFLTVFSRADLSRTVMFVVALCLTVAATNVSARELRAADTQNEDYPTVQALRFMGHVISERSNGRYQVKVFHSRQLGEEKETLEQTRAGAIDLNRTNVALIGNLNPSVNVLAMPFLFRSIEHMQKVLDGPIGAEILDSFEPHGFVGLAFYDSGARSIYNNVRPMRSLADVKGLRIRVQQSEQMSEMIRSLGAEPVELPYGQVLTGLVTKLIDGAENNWPSFVTTDHYRHAGYYTLTEHTMSPEVLVISHKMWVTLSPEDRKIFREAALRSSQFMREKWRDLEEQSRKRAESSGVTIVTDIDKKPLEAAMAGIYAKARRDPAAAQLIERIRKVQ